MSITIASIITNFNTYLGDTSNDRVSAAERLQYITEGTVWLQEELKNDHQVKTYDLSYLDTVNYYRVTTPLADLLQGSDLRRKIGENVNAMAQKSSRELAEEIAQSTIGDDSWSIERRNGATFLVVNAAPKFNATMVDDFESSTLIANWVADTTGSDALNVTLDVKRFNHGSSSLNFDIDVSQSANHKAVLTIDDLSYSLSSFEGTGVFLVDFDIPTVDTISGFNLIWGNDSSNYWTASVTTDLDGSAFVAGWNTLGFEWSAASKVGTPVTTSAVNYFAFTMNYASGQVDETDYRIDNFRIANPEDLTFYYVSWDVGTDTTGATDRLAFTATTDIPFFSGQYDQYKYAVAHMATSLAFHNLRLKADAATEESLAYRALSRARKIFPSSITTEIKSFKPHGNNLTVGKRCNS